MNLAFRRSVFAGLVCLLSWTASGAPTSMDLDAGWRQPPPDARIRAYWWWLNGNVTREAITRDLEEMAAKGWGGGLICDAGGASQDGNDTVPGGPTFLSPEWRELYKHALREADRVGLQMSLNIQSGWNLGGPSVTADDAAKKLTWSELRVQGPGKVEKTLPDPRRRDNYYRDLFVVAYRLKDADPESSAFQNLTASSQQAGHPAKDAGDRSADSFWVSDATEPGQGPTRRMPQWLQLNFATAVAAERLTLQGRPGYGPRECELQVSEDGRQFLSVKTFSAPQNTAVTVEFPEVKGRAFRVLFFSAFDPRFPDAPRNVQVAELQLSGKQGGFPAGNAGGALLQNWEAKGMHRALHFSAPDTTPLFQEAQPQTGEEATRTADVLDLTPRLGKDGRLDWDVPAGSWQILRFGCTIGDHSRVSTSSEGWTGYAVDVLDAGAFERYWDAVLEPLLADAKPYLGKALKYLHTDSWEVEAVNWTPTLREEFRRRRGYDFLPWLPALTGRIVNNRTDSNRFLHDFRKTLGDLAIDHHYRIFRDRAHAHGLLLHPESGGPHAVPIDAQRCLGWNDVPMSEFWAWSWRHRVGDQNRFFLKQPASAAHTYGRRLVMAEGFTTIGPHWQETIWDNLKPSFEKALCEGMNSLVWHAVVCSPPEMGIPGQQYFAGTHFNPNTTWWEKSKPFVDYVNRSQFLLQQGLFVADTCYYYGDHVPNFAQLKASDPARVLPGYDYDVITEEVILTRLSTRNGRLVLPDGMFYRVMVLPPRTIISLPVLRKLKELVANGATVIGPRPVNAISLQDQPKADAEIERIAAEVWGNCDGLTVKKHAFGKGRVFDGYTAREVLLADGIQPDFQYTGGKPDSLIDYVHRSVDGAEVYFIANRTNRAESLVCSFRVEGKAPELWDPVSGHTRVAGSYAERNGLTTLSLDFDPCGSWFVVFRQPAAQHPPVAKSNSRTFTPHQELTGPWKVEFDPRWGGPGVVQFDTLVNWATRPEPGVKYYSGTAKYAKSFELAPGTDKAKLWLDLGNLRELAEVRLNGQALGITWAPPFRVDISKAVKDRDNLLEVEVVNFWPNRIIGDAALPAEQRLTRTNIRKLTKETPLMESGLLGPVRIGEQVVPGQ